MFGSLIWKKASWTVVCYFGCQAFILMDLPREERGCWRPGSQGPHPALCSPCSCRQQMQGSCSFCLFKKNTNTLTKRSVSSSFCRAVQSRFLCLLWPSRVILHELFPLQTCLASARHQSTNITASYSSRRDSAAISVRRRMESYSSHFELTAGHNRTWNILSSSDADHPVSMAWFCH